MFFALCDKLDANERASLDRFLEYYYDGYSNLIIVQSNLSTV